MRVFARSMRELGAPVRSLMASDGLTMLSLMVGFVAMPWWITHEGGAADLTVWAVALSAVSLTVMPLLSPLADRYDRRTLIVAGLLGYGLSALGLAVLASIGRYRLAELIVLRSLAVVALAVIQPAANGLIAQLVAPARLGAALSLQQGSQSLGRMLGPALGGMLLVVSIPAALWAQAGLLIVAALFATRLPRSAHGAAAAAHESWWRSLRAGLRASWGVPLERRWIIVNFFWWAFTYPTMMMMVPLKIRSLGLSALWLGLCEAALSLGMLVGALGASGWLIVRFGRYAARIGCALLQAVALMAVGPTRDPYLLMVLFAVVGTTNSVMNLVGQTHRTLARPAEFRARMIAGQMTMGHVAAMVGPALAGAALLYLEVSAVYLLFGLLGGVAATALAFVPDFRYFLSLKPEEIDGWYLRRYPSAFEATRRSPR